MAKATHSINPFRLLADAVAFLRSQPALIHVLVWLLILPVMLMDVLTEYWPESDVLATQQIGNAGYLLAGVLVTVLTYWGLASVLLVGRRMVINRAGRSRTSFKAVRRESIRLIVPLFFTSLLRLIVTIEWALLAIVPAVLFLLSSQTCRATFSPLLSATALYFNTGSIEALLLMKAQFLLACSPLVIVLPLMIPAVIYQLRSAFFGIVLAAEDLRYRDALRRSRSMVRGRSWTVLGIFIVLGITIFLPTSILSAIISAIQEVAAPQLPIIGIVAYDILYAIAGLLFTLSLVALYGKLRKEKGRVEEVTPED